MRLPVSH